jgi:hypothetical protein
MSADLMARWLIHDRYMTFQRQFDSPATWEGIVIEASCHFGAIRMLIAERPQKLTSCNCSLCRRLGSLWAYYHPDQVTFVAGAGTTVAYVQGDRTLEMHQCPICGCVTHWESVKERS